MLIKNVSTNVLVSTALIFNELTNLYLIDQTISIILHLI